jgi:hypothetical protein
MYLGVAMGAKVFEIPDSRLATDVWIVYDLFEKS